MKALLFRPYLVLAASLFFAQAILAQPAGSQSLRMNGSSSYVNCGSMNLSVGAVTIQGWIKVQTFKTAHPYITSFAGTEQGGSHCAVRIGDGNIPNDRVQFILYIGGTHHKLHSQQALTTNDWYHIAATYDGAQMKIYINGILDTTRSQTGTIVSNDLFELGRNYADSRILLGELDEVSVFTTALSQSTIREWMCRRITPTHPNYGQLMAYWPLDEGSGSSTVDASGNGYGGSLISSPLWKNSGAPVGDASKFVYASSFDLGLSHPNGDSIHLTSTSGNFEGVHIYRVDSVPYVTSAPASLQFLDTSRYWGVFPITDAQYDVDYYYSGNATASGYDCQLSFARRNDGGANAWTAQTPSNVNYTGQVLSFESSGQKEIILAISNNGPHNLTFDIDEPLCYGESNGNVLVSVSGGVSPYSYSWQTGSTTSQSGNVASGMVSVTVTDDYGCTSTDSTLVDQPDSLVFFANTTSSVCKDTNTGTATAVPSGGVGGYSFLWDDQNASTTQTALSLYPGTYNVTVQDSNGCQIEGAAVVNSIGPDPVPDLGGDTNVCEGIIYGLTPEGGPFTSFAWSTGNQTGINVIDGPGIYSVTVENSAGCSGSDTIEVTYVEPIEVQLGPANQNANGSLTLDAGTGFLSYQWNTLANTSSITVTQSATYWVKVTDSNHCRSSDTVNVTITPTGQYEIEGSSITAFPNPAFDHVTLQGGSGLISYELRDAQGRVVMKDSFRGESSFSILPFPSGIYYLTITHEQGHMEVIELVRSR